jgi:chaperonin GroEL
MANEDKQLAFVNESETSIRDGVNKVCDAVGVTLGSDGKYVMIQSVKGKMPKITKDGVTVAREIQLEHPIEDCSAKLVIDGCMRTLAKFGDGTTSTAVQIKSLTNSIFDARNSSGLNMRKFMSHLNDLRGIAIESMKKDVIMDITEKHLIGVATTSANNDAEIGGIIGSVYHKIGASGIINVYYKDVEKIDVKYNEGYVFDSGLIKKEFINDGANCVLQNPLVIVTNRSITKINEIMRFMDYCFNSKTPLLIIASGYSEEVMATILKNVSKIQVCPIIAPSTGDMKNSYLEDICAVSGAQFINGEEDIFFDDIIAKYDGISAPEDKTKYLLSVFGKVNSVVVSKDEVVMHHSTPIENYVESLQKIVDNTDDELITEFTNKRISLLKSHAVDITFPILTVAENSFDHDRYDDSFKATLSALKCGISVGGGKSYINAYNAIGKHEKDSDTEDYKKAYSVIRECMLSVVMTSLVNGDYEDSEISDIVGKMSMSDNPNFGYNTVTKTFEDLVENGIIESGISAQTCFSNAFSIASTLTHVSCSITYVPSIF